ncbi:hypothetical protein QBC42DRAFT_259025 [Cladorrhinum samala]|uniref:Uncharacterized protein n=1 Tax=Cladorrhinum samala TaxID=585594 RepID=A0AAV9I0D3_9PEZI|nr:hypothetical protein QBC42DRAFT_259025 [Cladorrhinum samala]
MITTTIGDLSLFIHSSFHFDLHFIPTFSLQNIFPLMFCVYFLFFFLYHHHICFIICLFLLFGKARTCFCFDYISVSFTCNTFFFFSSLSCTFNLFSYNI